MLLFRSRMIKPGQNLLVPSGYALLLTHDTFSGIMEEYGYNFWKKFARLR